ncbi:HD domain-containing protein [Streptococcus cameli]
MQETAVLQATKDFVKDYLEGEAGGHDWWHIMRVTNMAERLAKEEGANVFLCQMAALLHDLADEKVAKSEEQGLALVQEWLKKQAVPKDQQLHILDIVQHVSYKAGQNDGYSLTLEGKVVQDADRLDALGAIGIARTMAYSGNKGRLIHDPEVPIRDKMSLEEYRSNYGTAITHFYEKLLRLSDKMQTKTGRTLAKERHAFLENYLQQFFAEWDGKC